MRITAAQGLERFLKLSFWFCGLGGDAEYDTSLLFVYSQRNSGDHLDRKDGF